MSMKILVVGLRQRDLSAIKNKIRDKRISIDAVEACKSSHNILHVNVGGYDYVLHNCGFSSHATFNRIRELTDNVVNYNGGISTTIKLIKELKWKA